MCLMEKRCMLDKIHSGKSCVAVGMSSMSMTQQYLLNKTSLNRSTRRIRLCIDWLVKML